MVCNKLFLTRDVLWTRLRVLPGDTLLLLNDQSGSVLGYSMIFSWAGCHSWYQSDYIHQSLSNNLNHMVLNKSCQDCLDFQNTLVC
jgi:hypothetical protein